MRTGKIFWLSSLVFAFALFNAYPGLTGAASEHEARGPIITHAFAIERGYYGYIWKIYLEAEDPDGQMQKIASVVDEVAKEGMCPSSY
jgi:hypothetical protein